jgi:hypothetical protein
MKLKILCLLALLACSGCYSMRYETNRRAVGGVQSEQWSHNVVGLLTITEPINVDAMCPNGIAAVENEVTFLNGLLAVIVRGAVAGSVSVAGSSTGVDPSSLWTSRGISINVPIWNPSTVRVMCAAGPGTQLKAPDMSPFAIR